MKITSLEKYVDLILGMKRSKDEAEYPMHQWFFRGQKDSSWSVVPSVFRNDGLQNEYLSIQKAIRQNPFDFKSLTEFEALTKLQHYGLGTRLLDVTTNPLVALYFATEPAITYEKGRNNQYTAKEKDGIVYFRHAPWHSVNELPLRITMAIPFVDFSERYSVEKLINYFRQEHIISDSEYSQLSVDNYALFIEYIQKSYFTVSSHSNERLIRQSGAFIIPTSLSIKNDSAELRDRTVEKSYKSLENEFDSEPIIIPSNCKHDIRTELDFFNINEATMFPELEHQMTYIQNTLSVTSGITPQFKEYSETTIAADTTHYSEATPDAAKVVRSILNDTDESVVIGIIDELGKYITLPDWKNKYQIQSQIRVSISRALQANYSAQASKNYAEKILELLLNPIEEYIAKE